MHNFYKKVLKFFKPLVIWTGRIHWPYSRKQIDGKFYYKVRDVIRPGTVLLTTTYGELSNLINPVDIKHAGIYVGKAMDGIYYVNEATSKGVIKTDLVTFLTTKDVVVAVNPNFLTEADYGQLAPNADKFLGLPYDYFFEKGLNALYCFENVVSVFQSLRPELNYKCIEIVKGKRIYDHTTFMGDTTLFTLVFDSRKMNL